ncbi:MAG: flagellar protein FlgN [Gammaproteobacteria bacterium]
MATHNPDSCRQRLGRLLEDEIAAIRELEQALATELAAITARDTTAIEQAAASKLQGLEKMEALNRQRLALIGACGFQPDREGMQSCLEWCDASGVFRHQWEELLALAGSCRERNRLNHHLVELGSRHMHQALCILRGEETDKALYDPLGNADDYHDRRTLARV